ncbi:hypothetical protein D3C71_1018900 [compost metagenome]
MGRFQHRIIQCDDITQCIRIVTVWILIGLHLPMIHTSMLAVIFLFLSISGNFRIHDYIHIHLIQAHIHAHIIQITVHLHHVIHHLHSLKIFETREW